MKELKFKDLEIDDIERISELVLIKDRFKVPFLESKDYTELELGEAFYLKYFDSFEKGIVNNNFTSKENMEFYRILYQLMDNNFSINYMNNIDEDNLELVFANTTCKTLAFLEIDKNDRLTNFRLISPEEKKVVIINQLPDLGLFINNHKQYNWPLISYHEPYLLNNGELAYINSLGLENEEKTLKMMEMDFNKLLKLKDGEEIYGYANKLIFNHFILNEPKSYNKKRKNK